MELLEPYRQSEDLQTLNALGIALTDAGRPAEGLEIFERALAIDPERAAYQNAGIACCGSAAPEARTSSRPRSRRQPARASLNALGVV